MKRKAGWTSMVGLGWLLVLNSALRVDAQTLPEGKGKPEFERICSNCHTTGISTRLGRTHEEWVGVVNDMVSRGAQGSRNDLDAVVAYLTANFGKGYSVTPGASSGQTATPGTVSKALPSATPLETARAKELIQQNGCLSCHRLGDVGSYQGPHLDGLGAHRTPEQIEAALVAPNARVTPENRTVHLVTQAGKSVNGRILNQDGFSVELINSASVLVTYRKADLREFSIIDTNPMPSYQGKISAEDLSALTHYLSSLNEGDR